MTTLFLALGLAVMNLTYSPDSSRVAYTVGGNLYIREVKSDSEIRVTDDGGADILNGYASWVYYEEILGRASEYKAFWWSPDSKRIAFYRFDQRRVPEFAIFGQEGQYGSLDVTKYPKAGGFNPEVRVGIADLHGNVTWVGFEEGEQYFGTPFWDPEGHYLYVQRMPRSQNQMGLYRINAQTAGKELIYTSKYSTWVNFMSELHFSQKGIYFVDDTRTMWEQIYFLSYDGKQFKQLTSGSNWDIRIQKIDSKRGDIWFIAKRDNPMHPALYRVDRRGRITAITDPSYWVKDVTFNERGGTLTAKVSTSAMPWKTIMTSAQTGYSSWCQVILDEGSEMASGDYPRPEPVKISNDGYDLYGLVTYPGNFSKARKYPVLMTVYGGPGNAYVRDRWGDRDATSRWCYENGIIYMVVDPRSSGENGRRGLDESYERITVTELRDYIAWARYMQSLPYVRADRIGVNGFSFGGTTTSMLVLRYPQYFCCGIAGGGVYDWRLYDSIYTERYMGLPSENEDGYRSASVLEYVGKEASYGKLRLTHGTADDNVHFQNTLQLADALQKAGIQFELMIYPGGKHGYRDSQKEHDEACAADFWTRNLLQ